MSRSESSTPPPPQPKASDSLTSSLLEATASLAQSTEREKLDATPHTKSGSEHFTEGVIVIVSRWVTSGREQDYEERLQELQKLLENQIGFQHMKAYQPSTSQDEHKVLLHFKSVNALKEWQKSENCRQWLHSVTPLEDSPPRAQIMTHMDMEKWADLPEQEGLHQPPKHKMALLTWLGIFPLATAANWVLAPHLDAFSPWIQSAISTAITVSLMTYGILPALQRMLSGFLYPEIDLTSPQEDSTPSHKK